MEPASVFKLSFLFYSLNNRGKSCKLECIELLQAQECLHFPSLIFLMNREYFSCTGDRGVGTWGLFLSLLLSPHETLGRSLPLGIANGTETTSLLPFPGVARILPEHHNQQKKSQPVLSLSVVGLGPIAGPAVQFNSA